MSVVVYVATLLAHIPMVRTLPVGQGQTMALGPVPLMYIDKTALTPRGYSLGFTMQYGTPLLLGFGALVLPAIARLRATRRRQEPAASSDAETE